jgi:hypothetical protein
MVLLGANIIAADIIRLNVPITSLERRASLVCL